MSKGKQAPQEVADLYQDLFNHMKQKHKPMNKQEFEQAIEKIGYKVKGVYPNSFIYDNHAKNTGIRVMSDHIELKQEIKGSDSVITINCYYDRIKVYKLSEQTICIKSINDGENTGFFILLHAF